MVKNRIFFEIEVKTTHILKNVVWKMKLQSQNQSLGSPWMSPIK